MHSRTIYRLKHDRVDQMVMLMNLWVIQHHLKVSDIVRKCSDTMQIVKRESQKLALRIFRFMSLLLRQEAMQLYEHAALLSNKQRHISIDLNHHLMYSNIDPGSDFLIVSCMLSFLSVGNVAVYKCSFTLP